MEHEDYIKKRDDVLGWKDRAWEEWHVASKGLDWSDSTNVQEVATEIRKRHQLEASQAIDALVLEVIGHGDIIEGGEYDRHAIKWSNSVLAERRAIVKGEQ